MIYRGISVVVPSLNQGAFIRKALDSILNQSNAHGYELEVIVCDGGSDDNTLDVLADFDSKIKWISGPDSGQGDAVNKGVLLAQYELIGWLNSDDEYCEGALDCIFKEFNERVELGVVYGRTHRIDKSGVVLGEMDIEPWSYTRLLEHTYICQPAVFFRKSLFISVGGINPKLHLTLDYELWLRMGKVSDFVFLDRILAKNRDYPETKTNLNKFDSRMEFLVCSYVYRGKRWSRVWLWRLAHFHALRVIGMSGPIRVEIVRRVLFSFYNLRIFFGLFPAFSGKLQSLIKKLSQGGGLSSRKTE